MMLLKIALLLYFCLEASAATSSSDTDGLQSVPDALKANGDVCKDCTQIFELLADLLSNADLQKKILVAVESLCERLPGTPGKLCKEEVEKMLPMALTFITAVIKPAEVCKIIGLCGSSDRQEMMVQFFDEEDFRVAPKCSFCILFVRTLESLLPKERTEDAVIALLEEICAILPSSYQDQCEGVVVKFSKTVLDAVLSYATPQAICTLIHMCKGQEAALADPCTLPMYRCRDMKTAITCGTMFYCQKFAWKPRNYNTV